MNRMNTRHTRGNAKDGSVQDFWSSSITGSKTNGSKRPLCESTCLSKPYTFVPVAGVVRRAQFHKVGVESRFSSTVYFYMCWSSSCSIVFITPATRHTLWGNLCASVEDKSIARHTTLPRQSGNSKDGCRASTSTYHTPFSWRKAEGRKHDSLAWNPPLTLTSIFLFRPAPLPLFPRFRTIPFLTEPFPTQDAISIVLDDEVLSEDIDFLRHPDREGSNRGGGGGGGGGAGAGGAGAGSGYAYAENGRTRRAPGWRRDE